MADLSFNTNTSIQRLVDYNANPLAPTTLLEAVYYKEGDSSTNGAATVNQAFYDILKDTAKSYNSKTDTVSILLFNNNNQNADIKENFKFLKLSTDNSSQGTSFLRADGKFTTITFNPATPTPSPIKIEENIDNPDSTSYDISLSLNFNDFTVNNDHQLQLRDQTLKTILYRDSSGNIAGYSFPEEPATYNRALIINPEGKLAWGPAGAKINPVAADSEGNIYHLIFGLGIADDTAPSNLYYDSGIFVYQGNLYQRSDETLKTFEEKFDLDFDELKSIKKGYFYWNDDESHERNIGIGAQSIEKVFPEIVSENENGIKTVEYSKLGVISLIAIDRLYEKIKLLELRIEELESKK